MKKMKLIITKNYEEMSSTAADLVIKQIRWKNASVIGLATGSSPLGMYRCLSREWKSGHISLSEIHGYNLDEYQGLSKSDPQSFYYYLKTNLVDVTDFKEQNLHVLDGMREDIDSVCADYEKDIRASGGLDLQLLGLGETGHIGFNEPDTSFPRYTHQVKLEEKTIMANARFFASPEQVPHAALTMGIGTIMSARKILLIVSGLPKAKMLYQVLLGEVRPSVPASILQFHPDVTIIADEDASHVVREKTGFGGTTYEL